jgi:hypothetical protein
MMPQEKNMKTKTTRWKISDELWNKIDPLLPVPVNTHPRGGGKKRIAYPTVMNGILSIVSG